MTTLSASAVDPTMKSVQCDICLPPTMATNAEDVLRSTGWLLRDRGDQLDVCPHCVHDKVPMVTRVDRVAATTHAPGRLPNLMLIGAAKAGTTSLNAYLDAHPDVMMAELKELRFFSDPHCADWVDWYRAQFDSSTTVVGESSTMYTRSPALPGVAARMAALVPDARLVYLVRDPVERAVASYLEERFQLLDPRPVEEAFADLDDPYNPYLAASRYAEQIEVFLEHYPREQLLVLSQSELQTEPERTMERLFAFIGVDPTYAVDTTKRLNEGSAKYEYSGMAGRLRHSVAGRALRKMPPGAREKLQSAARRVLSKPLEKPELTPELRSRLEDALRPDAQRLREMTGLELADWSV